MSTNTKNKKRWCPQAFLVVTLLSLAPTVEALEAILAADTMVSTSQPTVNFGTAANLQVGGGGSTLLRFDVASLLPTGTTSAQIAKAVLNVWVSSVTTPGTIAVAESSAAWTESGTTAATLPASGAALTTKAVSTPGQWVPLVVTTSVKKWIGTPSANFGLILAPAAIAPSTRLTLDSKENAATSHPAWLEIVLTGSLGGNYTLVVGKTTADNTGRTALSVPDFTTLTAALNKIPSVYSGGVCSARYLIKVLPGIYPERVAMKPCVDIEGSGELTTRITAPGGATWDAAGATLTGAPESELRFLTVENTGGNQYGIAIFNRGVGVARLLHVTAKASGAVYDSTGVVNFAGSSPLMTDVVATGTGGQYSFGVDNRQASSPTMTRVTATASAASSSSYGVYNQDSSAPTLSDATASSLGSLNNYGLFAQANSSMTLRNVIATATGGSSSGRSTGIFVSTGSLLMEGGSATGSDSNNDSGIEVTSAIVQLRSVEVRAKIRTPVSGSDFSVGMRLGAKTSGDLDAVRIFSGQGDPLHCEGLLIMESSSVRVYHSAFIDDCLHSINVFDTSTASVANSIVERPISLGSSTSVSCTNTSLANRPLGPNCQ